MPNVTNGNIYAPVMMIAERCADMILGKEQMPAEDVDVYRAANAGRFAP
jgi:choline dehydrogenase